MAPYEPLANDIAMTPRRAIVFAIGTLRRLPAAVLRCFKTLALDGFEIAVAVLQRISAIGSVGIVKEVLALPISNWNHAISVLLLARPPLTGVCTYQL